MRIARLAYLLAQHPVHAHRALVRRGLRLDWLDAFRPFWDQVRPPSLTITDYASYTALQVHFSQVARAKYPEGDHFEALEWQYARLLSYVQRRECHPLRWLPSAWHLRHCETVLEFGSGAAPYAYGVTRAWPRQHWLDLVDLPGLLLDYCRWQFRAIQTVRVLSVDEWDWDDYDGIVCTETFEHLPEPLSVAKQMMAYGQRVVFDYTPASPPGPRYAVLEAFKASGTLTGPDARGLYSWTRP